MRHNFIVIFITAPSRREASRIVSTLIKKRLAACGNILDGVDSTFVWKGKVEKARETVVMLKTKKDLFKKISYEVKRLHSYEVPEIIAVPIVEASKEYLEWIDENVK